MATWNLDKAHSEIEFKVRHMMISSVKGQFHDFDITVDNSSEDVVNAGIEVSIQTESINTKNEQRDQHLKSGDFFDVETFKTITFQSTDIEKVTDDEFNLTGNLTIKDITKSVTFKVEFGGIAKDPWGNKKVGYTVIGKINREEFGLTWNAALETGGVMVSEDVKFQADVQFVLSEG
ncbi:polyisoprenoid-binding protein [Sphingobacterium olei]|uniref:Polyisoprenoid-binding protein n=1 Tax=Sphingobacterium olei TaxID=2571155 RepID=A0A4U0P6S5_9SPHI|nr:YceI family protein [Sphingobacterium olei]TJZ63171.1 polyisoprenoid-binding protein [Sphingobacterium olei]